MREKSRNQSVEMDGLYLRAEAVATLGRDGGPLRRRFALLLCAVIATVVASTTTTASADTLESNVREDLFTDIAQKPCVKLNRATQSAVGCSSTFRSRQQTLQDRVSAHTTLASFERTENDSLARCSDRDSERECERDVGTCMHRDGASETLSNLNRFPLDILEILCRERRE